MALSVPQTIALFEVLEVPYATGYYTLDGVGTLSAQTEISSASQARAKTAIETHLATLTTANGETELKAYLDRWITLGTKVTRIEAGQIDELNGVTRDPEEERAVLKRRVQVLVPFFRAHEVIEKRLAAGGASIPFIR